MTAPKAKRMPMKPLPSRVHQMAAPPAAAIPAPPHPTLAGIPPASVDLAYEAPLTTGRIRMSTPPPPSSLVGIPPLEGANGKKKKKKKGKGKGKGVGAGPQYDGDDEEDEELPELEAVTMNGRGRSGSHTGLSPELESVHLSTTASLSASVAAAARLSPTAAAEAELLATADHLARSMEVDPEGMVNDEYWASFPDHLRNFVRHTYSQLSSPGNEAQKTQAMYAIAQQIHSGAGVNFTASATVKGTTRTATTRYPPGAFPANIPPMPPFDPSIFNEPAFAEAIAAANALHPMYAPEEGQDYGSEEPEFPEEEDYSEDDAEELDAHGAQFTVSYGAQPDAAPTSKKKKKKNRRNKPFPGTGTEPPPGAPAPGHVPETAAPARNLATPVSASHPRMPAPRPTPAPNPPPSSRAAGKQPMSYAQPAPANPPPQSRRAASKAPITSHAYPHNHAHHHPSPPSSNASQPHKHRPPANGATSPVQVKNNSKIWSTSTSEERERIKEFWLGLGEEERRNLVKIEKEAVLRKMKEQQRHSCMCAVCGRKRSVLSILCRVFSSLT